MNNKLKEINEILKKYGIRNNKIVSEKPINKLTQIKNETSGFSIDFEKIELEVNKIKRIYFIN